MQRNRRWHICPVHWHLAWHTDRLSVWVSLPTEFTTRKASGIPRLMLYRANITLEDNTAKAEKNIVSDLIFPPDKSLTLAHFSAQENHRYEAWLCWRHDFFYWCIHLFLAQGVHNKQCGPPPSIPRDGSRKRSPQLLMQPRETWQIMPAGDTYRHSNVTNNAPGN